MAMRTYQQTMSKILNDLATSPNNSSYLYVVIGLLCIYYIICMVRLLYDYSLWSYDLMLLLLVIEIDQ